MIYFAIGLAILVAVLLFRKQKPSSRAGETKRSERSQFSKLTEAGTEVSGHVKVTAQKGINDLALIVPPEIANLDFRRHSQLSKEALDVLMARLKSVPRPPHAMDQLISAEFLSNATSAELNELMAGEPQIAAKVLGIVNSPLYGLQKPLKSIGQAATYLGMNSLKGICLQYMLEGSFVASTPAAKREFDRLWASSAFSSELCFKLAQLLGLPDSGILVTQVVLSNLGRLVACSLLDTDVLLAISKAEIIERTTTEQERLGLCAAEIGSLLMQRWDVPTTLIDDVRDIEMVLTKPVTDGVSTRDARLGLCYLCKRLGERLVTGEISDPDAFDLGADDSPDLYYLKRYMAHPSLQKLPDYLRFPEIRSSMRKMHSEMEIRGLL